MDNERKYLEKAVEDEPQITLYCRKCRFSTMPSGWCGECYSYSGVTKDKLPETDEEISLRMWTEFENDEDNPQSFPDWLKERK